MLSGDKLHFGQTWPDCKSSNSKCQCDYRFFVLFRHIVHTLLHTSVPPLQCCIVQADTTLKLHCSVSLRGMMKTNTPPEDTVKCGTERTKTIPNNTCLLLYSFIWRGDPPGRENTECVYVSVWLCLQGSQDLYICVHVKLCALYVLFALCVFLFVCLGSLNWVEPEQRS